MPANRIFHKRALAGDRTNALNHLEWRVWTVYEMAADDFGVMRCHEEAWITAHPRFGKEKPRVLRAAIERVINSALLGRFKADNNLTYVYQRDWQDWQKIEWPSLTTNPAIPSEFLSNCTPATQHLFTIWPGGKRIRLVKDSAPDLPSLLPSEPRSELEREHRSDLALRAKTNTNANANASGSSGGVGGICDTPERRLWEAWRAKSLAVAHVVEPVEPRHAEALKLMEACAKVPDEDTRMGALEAFWALDERDRRRLNIPNRKIGYFVMVLTELVGVPSEDAELAKFVAGGR